MKTVFVTALLISSSIHAQLAGMRRQISEEIATGRPPMFKFNAEDPLENGFVAAKKGNKHYPLYE